ILQIRLCIRAQHHPIPTPRAPIPRIPASTITAAAIRSSRGGGQIKSRMRTTLGGGDHGVDDLVEALAAAGAEEFEREGADFLGPAHALEVAEEVGVDVVEGGGGGEMGEEVGFEGFWGGGIGWGG